MTYRPHDRPPAHPDFRRGGVLRDRGAARTTLLLGLVIVLLAVLCALAAPGAFSALHGTTRDWERLSFMAEVFAAGIGVLTVVAIAVAAAAFWYQAREYRLQVRESRAVREQGIRAEHRELTFKALDDPYLLAVWGGPADPAMRDDDPRLLMYANALVGFWQMAYDSGRINAAEARIAAREFFTGRVGRAYWAGARGDREDAALDAAERRFHAIFEEEYRAALRRPPVPDAPAVRAAGRTGRAGVAGVLAGAVLGYLVGRRVGVRARGRGRGR